MTTNEELARNCAENILRDFCVRELRPRLLPLNSKKVRDYGRYPELPNERLEAIILQCLTQAQESREGATWGEAELTVMSDMAKALEIIDRQTQRVNEGRIDAHSQVGTIALMQAKGALKSYQEWKRKPKLRPIPSPGAEGDTKRRCELRQMNRQEYDTLKSMGLLWEIYPEAPGTFEGIDALPRTN
jgi:uncharacterized protein YheU (UPF0270 family)